MLLKLFPKILATINSFALLNIFFVLFDPRKYEINNTVCILNTCFMYDFLVCYAIVLVKGIIYCLGYLINLLILKSDIPLGSETNFYAMKITKFLIRMIKI